MPNSHNEPIVCDSCVWRNTELACCRIKPVLPIFRPIQFDNVSVDPPMICGDFEAGDEM